MNDTQHVNELAKLERRKVRRASLFESELVAAAVKKSFLMLNPVTMARNPVMFVTEIGAAVTTLVLVLNISGGSKAVFYTLWVTLILWLTVLFANFAEALAEARGKAQADTLRKTRRKTMARRLVNGRTEDISSDELKAGDIVYVSVGEVIPNDGEIVEGVATVDESAITGESAPVVREAGGDRSGVTGGTRVLSDFIKVRITAGAGDLSSTA
jgi:K+-transporting ATPase ATPase B chain